MLKLAGESIAVQEFEAQSSEIMRNSLFAILLKLGFILLHSQFASKVIIDSTFSDFDLTCPSS
jgi:hypothetical protein